MSNSTSSTPTKSTTTPSPTITPLHDPSHQAKVIPVKPLGVSNREYNGSRFVSGYRMVDGANGRMEGIECRVGDLMNVV